MKSLTAPFAARRLGTLSCTLTLLLFAAASAQAAQPCRIDGKLVIRSAPCPIVVAEARSRAPTPTLVAAADDAEAPKKRTIAEIMREREAANRNRPAAEPERDGAAVLRERMGSL